MKSSPESVIIRMSVEEMRQKMMIQFNLHCDEMKEVFKKRIEEESETFLRVGLQKAIKDEANSMVQEYLRNEVCRFVKNNSDLILREVREEMEGKAKVEMKNMLYSILSELPLKSKERDEYF